MLADWLMLQLFGSVQIVPHVEWLLPFRESVNQFGSVVHRFGLKMQQVAQT